METGYDCTASDMLTNWATVKGLLEECLERPSAERISFLENACNDPQIQQKYFHC